MIFRWLSACSPWIEPEPEPPPPVYPPELRVEELPVGPTDPLRVSASPCCGAPLEIADPIVVDADGATVALDPEGRPVDGIWPPGAYTLTGAVGIPLVTSVPFEMERWGLDPVDPTTLVGRAWEMTEHRSAWDSVLGWLVGEPGAVLVLEDVEGDQALFSLVGRLDDLECVLLHGFATLTPNGSGLDWSDEALSFALPGDAGESSAYDLGLSVRWDASTDRAWATAQGTADTRTLETWAFEDAWPGVACALSSTVGTECTACPDGEPLCLLGEIHAVRLEEIALPDLEALPACGLDLVELDAPGGSGAFGGASSPAPLDCSIDPSGFQVCRCRTYAVQAWLPMALAGALAESRRRRTGQQPSDGARS